MKDSCEREKDIAAAVRSGEWTAHLRQHVADCEMCAEVMLVAQFLREEARSAEVEAHLPTASFLLWKTEIRQKQRALQQAGRPVSWAVAIGGVIFIAVTVIAFLAVPEFHRLLVSGSGQTSLMGLIVSTLGGFGLLGLAGATAAVLLGSVYLARAE